MVNKLKSLLWRMILKLLLPHSDPFLERRYMKEAIHFWKMLSRYNASHHTDDDMVKMQYTLLRENHVIEKGMSMRSPRRGFGQEKVIQLLGRLEKYDVLYGNQDKEFLSYPLSTIKTYIAYMEQGGVDMCSIKGLYNRLAGRIPASDIQIHAGVEVLTKEEILTNCDKSFESLLYSRHSIRYFSSVPVEKAIILRALRMAQRTPSACNRQAWKTHVFGGAESVELMKWQGGCRGFEEELKQSILVTANLKAFLSYEVHQAYVDGGLYAMNLMNALHSLGLGCIPLSCGFEYEKLDGLTRFGIPANEVPIVLIAFGHLPDVCKVAVSARKDITNTNTFH